MSIDKLTNEQVTGTCWAPGHGLITGGLKARINEMIDAINGVTLGDMDIYVDNVNGSDNGQGTKIVPFETFEKAFDVVRHLKILHSVRIYLIKTGVPYEIGANSLWKIKRMDNGLLTIIGVGSPNVVSAGPYTLTGSDVVGADAGIKLSSSGAGWTSEEFYGKFVRMLTGIRQNYVYPVFKNDADDIWSIYSSYRPLISDTFDVITPAVTLKANHLTIDLSECDEYWDSSWQNAGFALCNINIDMSDSTQNGGNLTIKGKGAMWADFVRVIFPADVYEPVLFYGPSVNYYLPMDTNLKVLSQSSIEQIGAVECAGLSLERVGGPSISYDDAAFHGGDAARVYQFISRGIIGVYESSAARMVRCAIGQFVPVMSKGVMSSVLVHGKSGSSGMNFFSGCNALLNNVHVLTGQTAMRVGNARISMDNCSCESTLTGFGLEAGANTHIYTSTTMANLVGTSGQILWTAPDPDVPDTWPTAKGDYSTDGRDSNVSWV